MPIRPRVQRRIDQEPSARPSRTPGRISYHHIMCEVIVIIAWAHLVLKSARIEDRWAVTVDLPLVTTLQR